MPADAFSSDFSILIPVALPSSGPALLRVARLFAPPESLRVTALHCWDEREFRSQAYEHRNEGIIDSPLVPLLDSADAVEVDPLCFVSADIGHDIVSIARERFTDLILMGWHRPMTHDDESTGPVDTVLQDADSDVALLLSRRFRPVRRVLVPYYGGLHDRRALVLAGRIARGPASAVTVLHVVNPKGTDSPGLRQSGLVDKSNDGEVRLKVVEHDNPVDAAIHEAWLGYDLIIAGASETWGVNESPFSEGLQRLAFATPASLLVVHAGRAHAPSRWAPESAVLNTSD
ncbi:MAG: universal stress protein [Rhodothermales bacterium]